MVSDSLRVLVADGDASFRRPLAAALARAGHRVDVASDGESAIRIASASEHDVILLDAAIPGGGGVAICRTLRGIRPAVPVMMLVGSAEDADRLREPCAGVDDWLEKPVPPQEVLARVLMVRRRAEAAASEPVALRVDGLQLDLGHGTGFRNGRSIRLTPREVGIVRWLYNHRTRAVSRAELLEQVWRVPGDLQTRTVDMTISNLRRKIELQKAAPRIIVTVKGFGYLWAADD